MCPLSSPAPPYPKGCRPDRTIESAANMPQISDLGALYPEKRRIIYLLIGGNIRLL